MPEFAIAIAIRGAIERTNAEISAKRAEIEALGEKLEAYERVLELESGAGPGPPATPSGRTDRAAHTGLHSYREGVCVRNGCGKRELLMNGAEA